MKKLLLLSLCGYTISLFALEPLVREDFIKNILGYNETELIKKFSWTPASPINLTRDVKGYDEASWCKEHERRAAIFQGTPHTYTAEANTDGYGKIVVNTGYTVAELEDQTKDSAPLSASPRFTILFHNPEKPQFTDIRYLQTLPDLKFAAFQIASTFNALEGGCGDDLTKKRRNNNLLHMVDGPAQGEEATIACAGATIYRKYFMHPTNLLKAFEPLGIFMEEAYGFSHIQNSILENDALIKKLQMTDSNKVGILLHENIAVTSGFGKGRRRKDTQEQMPIVTQEDGVTVDTDNTQIVHQIFTAVLDLRDHAPIEKFETLCSLLLHGSYRGTLLATVLTKQPTIVLTLMGGGVFGNKIEWIGDAILSAMDLIVKKGLNVILVYRPDGTSNPTRTWQSDALFLKKIAAKSDAINKTNLATNKEFNQTVTDYVYQSYVSRSPVASAKLAEEVQVFFPHKIFNTSSDDNLIQALANLTSSLQDLEKNLKKAI